MAITIESSTTKKKTEPYQAATLPTYQPQEGKTNEVYDAAKNSAMAELESAYKSNLVDMEAAREKVEQPYRQAANESAANYQREMQAFNEAAAASGIGTGSGTQARLAMMNQQQNDQTSIGTARANAVNDAETQILKLKTDYQNAVAQAAANNEYERAAALLKEYQNAAQSVVSTAQAQADENYRAWSSQMQSEQTDYQRMMADAETLAGFGDFSGYKNLGYTDAQVAEMRRIWELANPGLVQRVSANRYSAPPEGTGGTGDTTLGAYLEAAAGGRLEDGSYVSPTLAELTAIGIANGDSPREAAVKAQWALGK